MHQPSGLISLLLLLFTAAVLVPNAGARAQMRFEHVVVDPSGPNQVWGKSIGDLNHDGLPDLIAAGRAGAGGGLFWYENPTWVKRPIMEPGEFSTDHEVCDVDRDGDNDVVALRGASLDWLEAPSWTLHPIAGVVFHDIEVFDFEGDGDCDIAARNQGSFGGSGELLYLYEQQTPTSWNATLVPIPNGEGLTTADLDGDDDMDVVVNEVWIENTGADLDAWVSHEYTRTWTHGAAFVATADIDDDGDADIVLAPAEAAGESYRISWFEAPDDPTQQDWTEHIVDPLVEAVHHFVGTGDFDLNGEMDIVTSEMLQGADPDEVIVYLRNGGVFTKVPVSGIGSHSMRVVDLDLDGDLDLYGANFQTRQVDVLLNQTPKHPLRLDAWKRHVIDPNRPGRAIFIDARDLDGDRRIDVAAGGYWYRNPGELDGDWTRAAFGEPLNNLATLHDFDSDGDIDVLGTEGVGSEPAPSFAYGRNDGEGGFTIFPDVGTGSGDFLQGVAVTQLSPGETKSVALSWHSGQGGVEALRVPEDPAAESWELRNLWPSGQDEELSHADLDRDGDQDLLLGTEWLQNLGGSYALETLFNTSQLPDRNRLADIDRDGRLDAVVGYQAVNTSGVLAWYRQPAEATDPWEETVIERIIGPMSVDVADMDLDGDLDVVAGEHNLANPDEAGLYVFENEDGLGGTWSSHTVHVGDEHHDGARVVDVDQDGDLDVVSIGWGHDRVLVYENLAVNIPEAPAAALQAAGLGALLGLRRLRRRARRVAR